MKTGIVDVGGGLRGIYAAGVLDYCMDKGIRFDLGIGVSAGSANLISYAAGQRGRNYRFYMDYSQRREYMGVGDFLKSGSYINMDYMYSELSNAGGEDPLDYPAVRDNPMELYVVAADAETGEAHYFSKDDIAQDNYDILKASSSIPFVCRPYPVQGRLYYDGALGDPVPVDKALELGCDRVVVLLTKPAGIPRSPSRDEKYAAGIQRKYPAAAHALRQRASRYNAGVFRAQRLEIEGKALVVSPDDTCGVDTLTRDRAALESLYEKGFNDGAKVVEFMAGA
ncbi:MAG TPA: patatin family protein [Candidatus Scatomorpha gallistercoris]|nr:patatin family protein [Candidatus Scatomorpha gallistercoris]